MKILEPALKINVPQHSIYSNGVKCSRSWCMLEFMSPVTLLRGGSRGFPAPRGTRLLRGPAGPGAAATGALRRWPPFRGPVLSCSPLELPAGLASPLSSLCGGPVPWVIWLPTFALPAHTDGSLILFCIFCMCA
jgi:hypothetical protein